MKTLSNSRVAVLLATYNGERYIRDQIRSLKWNLLPFTVHWLDDHSTDSTRDVVRRTAEEAGVDIQECHQTSHQGVPYAFFSLLESVEADFYLFCDQDDIWQPGKIDATVAHLLAYAPTPTLSFSDPIMFFQDKLGTFIRQSRLFPDARAPKALEESRTFMSLIASGHTQGFTRSLRDIYLAHKDVARGYAAMHDFWMFLIAAGSGTVHLLRDIPTTLYRQHSTNFSRFITGTRTLRDLWNLQQTFRAYIARQATGFILASNSFPPSRRLDNLLRIADKVSRLDRRQNPLDLVVLLHRRAIWPSWSSAAWLAATCLCSRASTHPRDLDADAPLHGWAIRGAA